MHFYHITKPSLRKAPHQTPLCLSGRVIAIGQMSHRPLSSADGVQLPTWWGHWKRSHTCNPLTLWTVPVLVHVWVWVHTLGDPQKVQLRNATTSILSSYGLYLDLYMYGCGWPSECSAEERYNNSLTLWTVPVLVHVWVRVHTLGNPQCSAEVRYNKNADHCSMNGMDGSGDRTCVQAPVTLVIWVYYMCCAVIQQQTVS